MTRGDATATPPPARDVFVVGPAQSGSRLLYRLLCLHPEVAYVSNLEGRFPWLPVAVTGRLRPHRYSSKLQQWFGSRPDAPVDPGIRRLLGRMIPIPADAEVLCGRNRAGGEPLDARAVAKLRGRLARLRGATRASILAIRVEAASRRLPVVDALFPQARYLSVGGGRETGGSTDVFRALARVPASRVLRIDFEDLLAEPVDQLRRVLEFLRLERRRDYEWALKALKLHVAAAAAGREASNGAAFEMTGIPGEQNPYPIHSEYAS